MSLNRDPRAPRLTSESPLCYISATVASKAYQRCECQRGQQVSTSPTLSTNPSRPPTTIAPLSSPPPVPRRTSLKWSALFDGNMDVTLMGEMLLAAVFTHLDTSYSGYLSPEAYSGFLMTKDISCTKTSVRKANLIQDPVYGQSKENVADKALKNAYDLFSIEHILHERFNPPGSTQPSMTSQLFSLFAPGINVNASSAGTVSASKMPLLTLKGFIDITTVEILSDPSKGWGNLQRALKKYRLSRFEGWEDLPRHVLPEYPDARMLQRVQKVSEFAKARDEQLLASTMAEMQLRKQGRQNALDLLDDRRYYY
ncbi:hypothetical protein BDZ89DRAFT_1159500 [Hymenopellis radicata]|nr:hypothetical protein BDZ89DRAFT_1159500 [Hymenopellis radicata]